MGSPIILAPGLSRLASVKCPWCGHKKLVARRPVSHRVCPRCKKHFPDPLSSKKK
jgi:DNA-directed RNA polymerase subunit RPC12/RpoP